MNSDLEQACIRLATSFPDVDRHELVALVVTSYRVVSRIEHSRRIDKVEALCRLRLEDQTLPRAASAVRSTRPDGSTASPRVARE